MVQYRTSVSWGGGEATSETFVAASGDRVPPRDAAVFGYGATRVAVWRWPHDPYLPGLSDALDPIKMARLLDDLGIDGGAVQLRARAYRPGRRAVIEATGRRGRIFLKVTRPERVQELHLKHRALAAALPVPESLGWAENGVLVMTAIPGETLRATLRSSSHKVPSPASIDALLDRLPDELAEVRSTRELIASARHHAEVVGVTVPAMRTKVESLMQELADGAHEDLGPVTPVHGDLYEAQLMVDRGRLSGILDIDTAGAGYRVDDIANLCGHLSVLAQTSDRPRNIRRYGAALLAHAEARHDRALLRTRIAAAVLGLATGPFRVMEDRWERNTERRIDLAAEWLAGAR
jgi:aminoglycoside phosphotransferase